MALKTDRLTILPDELVSQILSFLPTKHAVSTTILSSRFNNTSLYSSLPSLDFDDTLYLHPRRENENVDCSDEEREAQFVEFVEKVLEINNSCNLSTFRLRFRDSKGKYVAKINGWIEHVVSRNVVEIDVRVVLDEPSFENVGIPPCESLRVLSLDIPGGYSLYVYPSPDPFPNLRELFLRITFYDDYGESISSEFIPSLTRLERLCLYVDFKIEDFMEYETPHFYIIGSALRSLDVQLLSEGYGALILVDAPNLEFIGLVDDYIGMSIMFVHLEPWELGYVPPPPHEDERFCIGEEKLPTGLRHVFIDAGDCDLYCQAFMDQEDRPVSNSCIDLVETLSFTKSLTVTLFASLALLFNDEPLPMFNNLTKLVMALSPGGGWDLLPQWLEKCPVLEILILIEEEYMSDIEFAKEIDWQAPNSVPNCLLLHLKQVEIRGLKNLAKRGFLKYLLKNSKVLEKLTTGPYEYVLDNVLTASILEILEMPGSNQL